MATTRDRLQRQLKNLLPGSRRAKQIKKAIAKIDAQAMKAKRIGPPRPSRPEVVAGPQTRRAGLGTGLPLGQISVPTTGPALQAAARGLETLGEKIAPGFLSPPPTGEVQGPPEGVGGPPTPTVEPAAPPRGAAPAGAEVPPQAAPFAPEEDPDQAILPFLSQAEQTPELAAFKALLEAPAPTFEKAGFSQMERAMLGMLAGLRGTEATLPIIEMRRQDARNVYNSAREVRAEKLSGLFQAASLAEQQKTTRFAQRMAIERGARGERMTRVAERGVAVKERGLAPQLQLLSSKVIGDFAAAIDATAAVRDFEQEFSVDQPGGIAFSVLPPITARQKETAADLQAIQQPILSKYLGAVRSIPELEGISSFVAPFGSTDRAILNSVRAMRTTGLSAIRTEIRARKLAGFDTSGIEQLLFEKGFSGVDVAPSLIPTLPSHLSLDPGEVLMDEGGQ